MAGSKALLISSQKRLNNITQALESVKWQIEAFVEPSQALRSMQQERYDAIFCDEKLKGASVKGFLNWHNRLNSDAPFYIIGKPSTSVPENTCFISYPLKVDDLPHPTGVELPSTKIFQTKTEDLNLPFSYKVKSNISLSGDSATLHIDNILELMGMGKQSSLILLGENGDRGKIYVEKGIILHASFKDENSASKIGLPALVNVLASEDLAFKVLDFEKPERNNVNLPVAYALTEAARLVDEHKRYKNILENLRKVCPSIIAAAIGDSASFEPLESLGEGKELFKEAQDLLKSQRNTLGKNLSAFLVVLGPEVLILETFGEHNLLAASALSKDRDTLYNVIRQALKQLSA